MSVRDYGYMRMAYGLARKAIGRVSPNPYVGAVIVRSGEIVGSGFHEGPGKPHAEVVALRQAGARARGATLYVTLEPCVHWGRTPPCVEALVEARLARVVVSDLDPNPLVLRKGVARLRREGLRVECGLLADENRKLNEAYLKYITRRVPFVILKTAISLDGRMATRTGESRWVSSAAARDYVHLLRGECDAVMAGINTVLRDDPRLTVRHAQGGGRAVVRVVLDSDLRLPPRAKLLATLDRGGVIVFAGERAPVRRQADLEKRGARVVRVPGRGGRLDLRAVLSKLGSLEIASVLVEGGGLLAADFLERRLADKLLLVVAPKLIGGREAPAFVAGRGAARMSGALELRCVRTFRLGPDTVVEGYL